MERCYILRRNQQARVIIQVSNIAFMMLVYKHDHKAAKIMGHKALKYCKSATQHYWRYATMGEAHLYLENYEEALNSYKKAVAMDPEPRELESMYSQAVLVARKLLQRRLINKLDRIFPLD